jgi:hypothetical protein
VTKHYEVILTQTRNTEFVADSEEEAIEGAMAEWNAEAPRWNPQVVSVFAREATADELIGYEGGLT